MSLRLLRRRLLLCCSQIKDRSTRKCIVQVMLKAVDDANSCVKSRLIVLKAVRSSTDGVTKITVFVAQLLQSLL